MVDATTVVSANVVTVPAVVASGDPLRYTVYPVTPTLSVEGFQVRSISVGDFGVAVTPPGTLGGVQSGVVTLAAVDRRERLPAASNASTV